MMSLRQTLSVATHISRTLMRNYSSGGSLVNVSINDKSGVATVMMQRKPVNGLNLELLTELRDAFVELEKNRSRGMILTSAAETTFSAGLDITEFYKPDQARMEKFWTTLQDTWIALYGSSYPTVAVINGHSPAGGCLLAMSCEYRIMNNNFTIGLNETKLGIIAPTWFITTMQNTISKRDSELALTTGRLFKTEEALKVGLIDEICTDKNDGLAKAETFLKQFVNIPPVARSMTKNILRGTDIENLKKYREKDLKVFTTFVNDPKVQKGLEMYMASLKKK